MLVDKRELCGKIDYRIKKDVEFNKDNKANVVNLINEKFNIPTGVTMDYIAKRRDLGSANRFILFALAYGLDKVTESKIVSKCFTEVEINQLSGMKYEEEKIKFPIIITCVQVNDNQWIGSCDMNFLMQLRDAQLINYNKNTQRTMQKIVRGDSEYYRISINNGAVDSIRESLNARSFIPNTITLNIPDTEYDFYYDKEDKELVIKSINAFDITDGYHRYLAMGKIHDVDAEFNYPLELRITYFPEDRTKQFIYQEDQKTKMRKIDSDSMNMIAPQNIITEHLNSNGMFYWSGEILRNEGRVNFAEFANIVDFFYYKGKSNYRTLLKDKKYAFDIEKEIVSKLNKIIVDNDELMTKDVSFVELMILFRCITLYNDTDELLLHAKKGLANAENLHELVPFQNKKARKVLLKYIDEVI